MSNEVANPFGEKTVSEKSNGLVEVESQRAIAETQAAMIIARKFPRDPIAVMDRILNACTRVTLAESALYSYSKGGTEITGPSIRLAEVLAQEWGNIQFGIRELDQIRGESTVEAYCWDVERNVRQVKTFKAPHKRYTKKGTYSLEDPRDIYENVANQGARRLRACILGVIPGDVVEAAQKQCEMTLTTKIQITPDVVGRMLEKFNEFGVTKEQIEKRIQRRVDTITPAQMVQLGKIANSLKDGISGPSDWFEVSEAETGKKSPVETLKERLADPVPTVDAVPEPPSDPVGNEDPKATNPEPSHYISTEEAKRLKEKMEAAFDAKQYTSAMRKSANDVLFEKFNIGRLQSLTVDQVETFEKYVEEL